MSGFQRQKIVVPIDFSDESFEALDVALQIVDEPAHVHMIHVLAELSPAEPGVIWGEINNENRARHVTESLRKRLTDAKYKEIGIEVAFGDAGHRIAEYAKKIQADLIVMPSHGRRGIKRLLIGSVAERVVRLAHCPVLVLRK